MYTHKLSHHNMQKDTHTNICKQTKTKTAIRRMQPLPPRSPACPADGAHLANSAAFRSLNDPRPVASSSPPAAASWTPPERHEPDSSGIRNQGVWCKIISSAQRDPGSKSRCSFITHVKMWMIYFSLQLEPPSISMFYGYLSLYSL